MALKTTSTSYKQRTVISTKYPKRQTQGVGETYGERSNTTFFNKVKDFFGIGVPQTKSATGSKISAGKIYAEDKYQRGSETIPEYHKRLEKGRMSYEGPPSDDDLCKMLDETFSKKS